MCLGLEIRFSRVGVRVRSGCGLKVGFVKVRVRSGCELRVGSG